MFSTNLENLPSRKVSINSLTGLKMSPAIPWRSFAGEIHQKYWKTFQETKGIELPESVDWRKKGAVREVKDQEESCGSCWSFSTEKYSKSYRSPQEARKRLAIFSENLKGITAHNALYELGETTFNKGINKFADWTQDEFMQYLGKALPTESTKNTGKLYKKTEGIEVPQTVDWREKGAVRGVKEQGSCGSSWSFSTTGAVEGQYSIVKNETVSLSEQNLVDCDPVNFGCKGGWPVDALEYVKQNGIQSEQDYPYKGYDGQCKSDSPKTFKIAGYEEIPEGDEDALKEVVATKGPVSISLLATINFQFYESGILKDANCSHDIYNHAVLVVGYGSENGQDYYIVKNSWGPEWGEEGYIRLARNYDNMCGLASRAVIPVA